MSEIRCSMCGREIVPGNDENGMPNGVGFVNGGQIINICAECLCRIGYEAKGGEDHE